MKLLPGASFAAVGIGAALFLAPALAGAQPISRAEIDAALPKLEALAQAAVDQGQVPGLAIAIVHHDALVYLKGFGVREVGKPDKVDPDTVFQLASFSKPISATVVAAVVSENKVAWDSKIADLDPAFRLSAAYPSAELTVRDLFAHRSGLPGNAGNELEDIGYDRAAILERLRLVPLDGFRSHYSYSNFGLTEGAVAVAKSQGMAWEDLAEAKLYKPLGMKATSSRYADFLAQSDRAALHIRLGGQWQAALTRDPDAQAPAGGVSSSARDLVQWLKLEIGNGRFDGKQVIESAALAETHQPLMARGVNPANGAQSFYGLGWNVEFGRHGLVWGHAGAFSNGARTLVSIMPDDGLGIVVLSNAFPTGVPEGLADSFFDLVKEGSIEKDWIKIWNDTFDGLFGPAVAASKARLGTPPQNASPALPAAAYVGRYANDYFGTAIVTEAGGKLQVALGPKGQRVHPLQSFNRDVFIYPSAPEMPDLMAAATFEIGPDGKASALTLEDLDDLGFGRFARRAD
ncbi:serine hydrolase [Kaistia dalseonensis]|uniref:CubicO group peptidase (Beta-lactamase class C family) n=1 Tax=Kaistia dalseonensis TaxID=410840 RepID=A0ABU0H6A5_9HYPH|nr:serine hydrolase [Kaistia dalseonensis]MCX5495234.1 serine hydrolase [Kaistia dalseonensis]MDQ0437820.1 CubicO group peptidase (beta-lactamase class C family) [Kaistia dalseonensis]